MKEYTEMEYDPTLISAEALHHLAKGTCRVFIEAFKSLATVAAESDAAQVMTTISFLTDKSEKAALERYVPEVCLRLREPRETS